MLPGEEFTRAGQVPADQWYNAHGSRTLQAVERKRATLETCVDGFVDNLLEDPNSDFSSSGWFTGRRADFTRHLRD